LVDLWAEKIILIVCDLMGVFVSFDVPFYQRCWRKFLKLN